MKQKIIIVKKSRYTVTVRIERNTQKRQFYPNPNSRYVNHSSLSFFLCFFLTFNPQADLNAQLLSTVNSSSPDLVRVLTLLNLGADASAARSPDAQLRNTPLHIAVSKGNMVLCEFLLMHPIDVNAINTKGMQKKKQQQPNKQNNKEQLLLKTERIVCDARSTS